MFDRYAVHMTINPDQPDLAYWCFATLEEAERCFKLLKKGMTAYTITLTLTDNDLPHRDLQTFKLGDEDHEAVPAREKVDYREMILSLGSNHSVTGSGGHSIVE